MNFKTAKQKIAAGELVPHSLWLLLSNENDREGFALRPQTWEGPGAYQHVSVPGRGVGFLVKLPTGEPLLTISQAKGEWAMPKMTAKRKFHVATARTPEALDRNAPQVNKFLGKDMLNVLEYAEDDYGLYKRAFKGSRAVVVEVRVYPAPKRS